MTTTAQALGRARPLDALRYRDFRLYWLGAVISLVGTQMHQAGIAWQVYVLTHSPIALGLIGLVRIGPIILFSLVGGVVADAIDRRRLLLVTETVLLAVSGALAVLTYSGLINIWLIYALTGLASGAVAFDNPARQSLVPALVPRDTLANALSLSTMAWQMGAVVGPSAAGIVIAASGIGSVYVADVISYIAVLAALLLIHPPPIEGALQQISIRAGIDGLRFVRRTPIILSTMGLDFVATFFGSATALLPIFARDILHVGSQGYGFLYAAPSVGAIAAGVVMSFIATSIGAKGKVILAAVAAYAVFTILFGLSHVYVLSLLALAGTGASDTVSMILRQTIRQLVTPDALRGRMTSVNMVFFMGGPQLGEVEAGLIARAFGAPISVLTGGVAALVCTLLIAWHAVGLRRYGDEHLS